MKIYVHIAKLYKQEELKINNVILLNVLSKMIEHNTQIINKYGITCYLREENNVYYHHLI